MTAAEVEINLDGSEVILGGAQVVSEPLGAAVSTDVTVEATEGSDDDLVDMPILLVDQAAPVDVDWMSELEQRTKNRLPIIPLWLRSKTYALSVIRWQANHAAYVVAYHATRSPKYAAKLAARSPQGAAKVARGLVVWTFDLEGKPIRQQVAATKDGDIYLRMTRAHDKRVKNRLIISLSAAVVLALGAILLMGTDPSYDQWLALGGLVALLGRIGTPADRQVFDRAVIPTQVQKLTSDLVLRALGALGVAELNKAVGKGSNGINFPTPIVRDGPGWRADIDLPFGVTATDIMEKRVRLASALRRPLGCVWPEPAMHIHPGRVVIWVGDQDMNKAKRPAWPYAKTGQIDVFKPIPFGTDQRGREIAIPLIYRNMLIGAMPGFGKTFALRVLLLGAALDPSCELRVFELKGTGDLKSLSKVAHHYASGAKDSTIEACVVSLREVYKDLEKRADTIDGLPEDVCPENKVTADLAAQKSLGLHPLVVAVDECQELFAHEEFGAEAEKLCTAIIKRGRALGIILLLATQRPDKDSMPTGVSGNVLVRFCLKVAGQTENDMVLGTSAYKNGIRATVFTDADLGIGYLLGVSTEARITRGYYIDNPAAGLIADRARALRIAAGTLSGQSAGDLPTPKAEISFDLVADVLAVVPASEEKQWNSVIIDRLAVLRPDVYGPWADQADDAKTAQLTAALKPYGIQAGQVFKTVDGKGSNRRGITRTHLVEAAPKRIRVVR